MNVIHFTTPSYFKAGTFFSLEQERSSLAFLGYIETFLDNCFLQLSNSVDPQAWFGETLCNVLLAARAKVPDDLNREACLPACAISCSGQMPFVEFCCHLLSYITKLT